MNIKLLILPTTLFIMSCSNSNTGQIENFHTIIFDSNGGSYVPAQQIAHGEKITKPTDPVREGHTFDTWTYNNEEWSFVGYSVTSDMTLLANWTANTYMLTLNNSDPELGKISGSGSYTYGDDVTISATPLKEGYSFIGWFDTTDNLVSDQATYSFTMGLDLTLLARWSINRYTVTIESNDISKGNASILYGSGYSYEKITVEATPLNGWAFEGWYHETTKLSSSPIFSFIMPTNDVSLIAYFFSKEEQEESLKENSPILSEDEKKVSYGLYPQTYVSDLTIISSLDGLSTPALNNWYLYEGNYYAKEKATPSNSSLTFKDGTKIVNGEEYWFKCEPIIWNVLDSDDGSYYLLSEFLLDARFYNKTKEYRVIDGQNISGNNYFFSDIRSWLNLEFYNFAFILESAHIQTTLVDNSAETTSSTNNTYACENTLDKVFLPSYKDYLNELYGFSDANKRCSRLTDYAIARGSYCYTGTHTTYLRNGYYWTRSPCPNVGSSNFSDYAENVNQEGSIGYNRHYVNNKNGSVRPAISIKINL